MLITAGGSIGALRKRSLFDARSAIRRQRRETSVAVTENSPSESEALPARFISSLPPSLRTTALLALTGHTKAEIASKIGAICYYVSDIEKTEAFYRDVLDLDVQRMGDDGGGNDWLLAKTANNVDLIFFKQESRPGNSPIVYP